MGRLFTPSLSLSLASRRFAQFRVLHFDPSYVQKLQKPPHSPETPTSVKDCAVPAESWSTQLNLVNTWPWMASPHSPFLIFFGGDQQRLVDGVVALKRANFCGR
jgi:hypothetical protein